MKSIIISPRQIKKEALIVLIAFMLANILNIYAIIHYQTEWKELLTHLHVVIILTGLIYLLAGIIRGIIKLIKGVVSVFKRKR